MGFGEIQFDYIRFPEPYPSLPPQVFPEQNGRTKPQVLAEFLTRRARASRSSACELTADIFGLVTTVGGALEVGQKWEPIARQSTCVLPMVYPSHYPPGSFQLPHPNADPYDVIHIAISRARERDEKLGIKGEHVRPWLQAFSTRQLPKYGAARARGAEARGVRLRLRRMGAVGAGLTLRQVPSRAREDVRVAEEESPGAATGEPTGLE